MQFRLPDSLLLTHFSTRAALSGQVSQFLHGPNLAIQLLVILCWFAAAMLNPVTSGVLTRLELAMLGGMIGCFLWTLTARNFLSWRCAIVCFYLFDITAFKLQIITLGERGAIWALLIALIINFGTTVLIARLSDYLLVIAVGWLVLCYGQLHLVIEPEMTQLFYVMLVGVVNGGISINFIFMRVLFNVLQLKARYQRQAETDALTGITNRRVLVRELQRACEHPEARGAYFVMLDLDDFKRINDEFGHDRGDETLKTMAATFARCCPQGGYGRLGGEEFGIVFANSAEQDVVAVLVCLFRATRTAALPFTFSAGLAPLQPGSTASDVLLQADKQLYLAKRAGKSQLFANDRLLYCGRIPASSSTASGAIAP